MNKKYNYENINNIKILSLRQSVEKTFDSWYSSICRWYSRNFYTPLSEVEDMPAEIVLKTYYDDVYYKLANANDEESQKMLKEEIERIVYQETKTSEDEEIEELIEQDDEEWYQEELRRINDNLAQKQAKPNLNNTEKDNEFVDFDEEPPNFEDDN